MNEWDNQEETFQIIDAALLINFGERSLKYERYDKKLK